MTLRDINVRSDDKFTRCFSCRLLTSALSLFFKLNVFGLLNQIYLLPSIFYTVTIVASPAVQIKLCTEYNNPDNTNGFNYRLSQSTDFKSRLFDFRFTEASANACTFLYSTHVASSFMHPLKFGERTLVVSRRYPRMVVFEKKKTFCGFPWVETSTAGRVYDLCVYYMTGAPEGSPKVVLCGFMGFFLWRRFHIDLQRCLLFAMKSF